MRVFSFFLLIFIAGTGVSNLVAEEPHLYVHGFGGANYLSLTNDSELRAEPGFMFGAGVGLKFINTRLEIEVAYRRNDFKEYIPLGYNVFFDGGKIEKTTCFMNFFYDFPGKWFIDYLRPYVGVGCGYKFDSEEMKVLVFETSGSEWRDTYEYKSNGMTGQLIVGVGLPMSLHTVTKIEYRVLKDDSIINQAVILNLDRTF